MRRLIPRVSAQFFACSGWRRGPRIVEDADTPASFRDIGNEGRGGVFADDFAEATCPFCPRPTSLFLLAERLASRRRTNELEQLPPLLLLLHEPLLPHPQSQLRLHASGRDFRPLVKFPLDLGHKPPALVLFAERDGPLLISHFTDELRRHRGLLLPLLPPRIPILPRQPRIIPAVPDLVPLRIPAANSRAPQSHHQFSPRSWPFLLRFMLMMMRLRWGTFRFPELHFDSRHS